MSIVKKYKKPIALIILLALVVYLSFNSYFVFVGINSLINAIAVMGVVIISGYAKQLHLGQAAFLGIGAYTSAILTTKLGLNFWLTIPVCCILYRV